MKALTKKIITSILICMSFIAFVLGVLSFNSKTVNATVSIEGDIATSGFYMSNGASVRDSGTRQAGLRWYTNVTDDFLEYLENQFPNEQPKFGTLVVGVNNLGGNDVTSLTKETPTVADLSGNLTAGQYSASIIYNKDSIALSSLNWASIYKAELIGRAYVQVGDTIIYAKAEDTQRCMRAVAAEAYLKNAGEVEDYLSSINVIELAQTPHYDYENGNTIEVGQDVPNGKYTAYVGATLMGEVTVTDGVVVVDGLIVESTAKECNLHLFDKQANDYVVPFVIKSDLQFTFGAYRGVGTGRPIWSDENGVEIEDVEQGNAYALEKFKDFKAAGLDVYIPGDAASYAAWNNDTSGWETSNAKRMLDLAAQADVKVILKDGWIYNISNVSSENDTFETTYPTQAELEETIRIRMAPYVNHPAFYGVMFVDEPRVSVYEAAAVRFGRIYKAIKAVYPQTHVHFNLLPAEDDEYYQAFIDEMGADYIMYDHYPLYTTHIFKGYIGNIQRFAEFSKRNNVDMEIVTQTYKLISGSVPYRNLDEKDLYWLNNMLVGFGCENIVYYMYYTRTSESYEDGYSFLDANDQKTQVYYSMQKIMAEMQELAPTILQYDYNASRRYIGDNEATDGCNRHKHYSGIDYSATFEKIANVDVDYNVTLVTELKNDFGKYMYMVQNIADPDCVCDLAVAQTAKLTFSPEVKSITVYKNGVPKKIELVSNTYTVTQNAGEAVYIVIND